MENKNLLDALTKHISKFNNSRNSMTVEELQDLRESIALDLFYISDNVAQAIANYEAKDYDRKRFYAEREEFYRNDIDERTGKVFTVSDSERKARLDASEVDKACSHALKQKERARLVVTATQQILNSIAMRVNQLTRN